MKPAGWQALSLLLTLAALRPAAAQMSDQSFEVTSQPDSVTVGDTVTLHLRLRLADRDLLFDTLPVPVGPRDRGVQILSISRLTRGTDRVWTGEAKVAYYRPGTQALPNFGVAFARVVAGVERAVFSSENGTIDIIPTLPAGDQPLKDIKPIEHSPAPIWPWLILPLVLLAAGLAARRIRRPRITPKIEVPAEPLAVHDPVESALGRLSAIEAEHWLEQGQLARHYEAVANVVRDYLAEAEHTPARELTSSELIRELRRRAAPSEALARCRRVLGEADAVKFAAVVPGGTESIEHLSAARILISEWPAGRNGGIHAAG
ncbi:MAG: hypothetical protein ABJC74_17870 [Gemmatimonadota bacterium]